jgi:hypothetical protein
MNTTETRSQHLQWCKQRALQYVEWGDNSQALASMASDLGKHEETKGSVSVCQLGLMMLMQGLMNTKHQGREFINGFN